MDDWEYRLEVVSETDPIFNNTERNNHLNLIIDDIKTGDDFEYELPEIESRAQTDGVEPNSIYAIATLFVNSVSALVSLLLYLKQSEEYEADTVIKSDDSYISVSKIDSEKIEENGGKIIKDLDSDYVIYEYSEFSVLFWANFWHKKDKSQNFLDVLEEQKSKTTIIEEPESQTNLEEFEER